MSPTSSSAWVRGLLRMFAEQGLDADTLLAHSGLDTQTVADPDARFGADDITSLWETALRLSGNPALGIDVELAQRHTDFQEVGVVMLSCAHLREGLDHVSRYLALISNATAFRLTPDARGCWVEMDHVGISRPVPVQRSAYSLLAVLAMCRWVTRSPMAPLETELAHPPAPHEHRYQAAFHAPVRWNARTHRMLLGTEDLDAPIPSRDPALLPLHARTLDERLHAMNQDGLAQRVREVITVALPRGEPRRRDIAQRLGLSERALTHQLQRESLSYQALLDQTRKALAQQCLREGRLSLVQIGHQLGFSDESNFVRACHRWFGMAPGTYRSTCAAEAAPSSRPTGC